MLSNIKSRAQFKYALRFCKKNKELIESNKIASKLLSKNTIEFWQELNKINADKKVISNNIDGLATEHEIGEYWKDHYCKIFNSVPNSRVEMEHIKIRNGEQFKYFSCSEVIEAINSVNKGKSPDRTGLSIEHILYAHEKVHSLITMCFNAMFKHSFMPEACMDTIISPIVKDKTKNITDSKNYRPIAIASTMSKILEKCMLKRIQEHIYTEHNQFGFKQKHGTDLCNMVLKEAIRSYKSKGSSVFVCFMDASKAFDRVNHKKLFHMLLERNVPSHVVKMLAYWYKNQNICVKWGKVTSSTFKVSNGVRQGGVLSPFLFNIYVDCISKRLNVTKIGCVLGNSIVNHIFYADDLVLISPSLKGLQKLMNICYDYGTNIDILFNETKTKCVIFKSKKDNFVDYQCVVLGNQKISYCKEQKYLGHMYSNDLSDDDDIWRQTRSIYARGNAIVNKFQHCSNEVKIQLFKAYICNLYTSQLWCEYKASTMHLLKMSYNNVFRKFFGLNRRCSVSTELVQRSIKTFQNVIQNYIRSTYKRLYQSKNVLLSSMCKCDIMLNSKLMRHWYNVYNSCSI